MSVETYTDPITKEPVAPATDPAVELPIEAPKPMKLSEAMRLGSIATTQSVGSWSKDDPNSEGGKAMCAMSTAWYALTGHGGNDANNSALTDLLERHAVSNPVSGEAESVASVVIDLNDQHKWSRTQIADWLESIGL